MAASKSLETMSGMILKLLQPKFALTLQSNPSQMKCNLFEERESAQIGI